MNLPTPSLTATILPSVNKYTPREVVVHEGRGWQRRIAKGPKTGHSGRHTCSRCGADGHNKRGCR